MNSLQKRQTVILSPRTVILSPHTVILSGAKNLRRKETSGHIANAHPPPLARPYPLLRGQAYGKSHVGVLLCQSPPGTPPYQVGFADNALFVDG